MANIRRSRPGTRSRRGHRALNFSISSIGGRCTELMAGMGSLGGDKGSGAIFSFMPLLSECQSRARERIVSGGLLGCSYCESVHEHCAVFEVRRAAQTEHSLAADGAAIPAPPGVKSDKG